MTCDQFPDVFEPTPDSASDDLKKRIAEKNIDRQTLYTAVRYLLVHRFNYAGTLPPATKDLDQRGKDAEFPFFLSIYGMLVSDSFSDPTMGKRLFSSDDISDVDNGTRINIARRFVDQVVTLVAEYQASESMFGNVYATLRDLGTTSVVSNGGGGSSGGGSSGGGSSGGGGSGGAGGGAGGAGGSSTSGASSKTTVFAQQLAEVSRHLVEENADAADPQVTSP